MKGEDHEGTKASHVGWHEDHFCRCLLSLAAFNGRQKRYIPADKQKYSSSLIAVLKQHNVTESAEIGHKMAESTNLTNGFYRLLARSQHLAAEKILSQKQDLSVKTRSAKQPERDILTTPAT